MKYDVIVVGSVKGCRAEHDVRASFSHQPEQLRKPDIVADTDPHGAEFRWEDGGLVSGT